jgi:hypothetical protein
MNEEPILAGTSLPRRLLFRRAVWVVVMVAAGLAAAAWVYRSRSAGAASPHGDGIRPWSRRRLPARRTPHAPTFTPPALKRIRTHTCEDDFCFFV